MNFKNTFYFALLFVFKIKSIHFGYIRSQSCTLCPFKYGPTTQSLQTLPDHFPASFQCPAISCLNSLSRKVTLVLTLCFVFLLMLFAAISLKAATLLCGHCKWSAMSSRSRPENALWQYGSLGWTSSSRSRLFMPMEQKMRVGIYAIHLTVLRLYGSSC